ncbi:MAG: hypothetical protein RLZZ396_1084 [Planctomycetota bacterium]|jgi:hypothetical protein
MVLFVLVLVLNEMVLVLEETYWNAVDIRSQFRGSSVLKSRSNGIDSGVSSTRMLVW